jgi:hypothetical protein
LAKLNVYQSKIDLNSNTIGLYGLAQGKYNNSKTDFITYDFTVRYSTNVKSIYKNGAVNSSIFEDGLNKYLNSQLTV